MYLDLDLTLTSSKGQGKDYAKFTANISKIATSSAYITVAIKYEDKCGLCIRIF